MKLQLLFRAICCFFTLGFALNGWCESAIHDQLSLALKDLKNKDYEKAINRAKKPLDALQLNTVEDIILAHKVLAVSYCEIGDQAKATEHFDALVTFSPNESIQDIVRSKPCEELYAGIQKNSQNTNVGAAKTDSSKPLITASAPAVTTLESSPPPEGSVWHRYIPFGVGQFKNDQNEKGLAFMSTEIAAYGVAIAGITLFKSAENADGTFNDPQTASAYRAMYWSGLGVGTAALIWGVVDAVLVYKKKQNGTYTSEKIEVGPTSVAFRF